VIVRTLDEVVGSDRDIGGDGWRSRRLLLRRDELGFSFHDTTVAAGSELNLQYRHHLEACYCLEGEAELIEGYLPDQLSDEELGELVGAAIDETGASEQKQMGDVMSALMPKLGGRADGKRVSQMVRERLGT